MVRSFELGHGQAAVLRGPDGLTAEPGLDRERARWWTIAWSCGGDYLVPHVETARWLLGGRLRGG